MNTDQRVSARYDDAGLATIEQVLGHLLMAGLSISTALLCAGLGIWLVEGSTPWSSRLLDWGLLALMGTPILRVVVSLVEYARLREWTFVLATLGVMSILLGTIAVALRAN